tara:strand:- start:547 stop:780 length:234 start_codon:yes stop_codon:yes gene_type:complete
MSFKTQGVYQMFIKAVTIFVMLVIIISLASGVVFLVRDEGKSQRTVKALTWRIALSLGLFLFLLIAFALGWISPHGI